MLQRTPNSISLTVVFMIIQPRGIVVTLVKVIENSVATNTPAFLMFYVIIIGTMGRCYTECQGRKWSRKMPCQLLRVTLHAVKYAKPV